ncbi:hypothetical protein HY229_04180 [Candidatus Acetothermia bacterium]|nr:hypothetical protein [Candidatus Acetothermia bacterium]MBI3643282.1 hypothetical protein [Candidatus Acetothermia bacterium]
MRPEFGSRKRFLIRMVTYLITPLFGIYLLLTSEPLSEGSLVGGIAIVVGALALYMLFSRLKSPASALRYALQPDKTIRELLMSDLSGEPWRTPFIDWGNAFHHRVAGELPDIELAEVPLDNAVAFVVGDEYNIILAEIPSTAERTSQLLHQLHQLEKPLHSEKMVVVFGQKIGPELRRELGRERPSAKIIEPD